MKRKIVGFDKDSENDWRAELDCGHFQHVRHKPPLALAREFKQLLPLVISSAVCWLIALTIFLWWKPVSRRHTSSGYMRGK